MRKTLLIAALLSSSAFAATKPVTPTEAPLATPPGVTIKIVQIGERVLVPGSNSNQPREHTIFADDKGRTLYTSQKDTQPGKSACVAECAKEWPPFAAPASAKTTGDWTVIARDDGATQWAFRGRPLYLYAKEGQGGTGGMARSPGAAGAGEGSAAQAAGGVVVRLASANTTSGHEVDGRTVTEITPDDWLALPRGISVHEIRTAPGYTLVNGAGAPLYTFAGKPGDKMHGDWTPALAPQLSLPVGDFTILARPDGITQWAYKGQPLYAYKGDSRVGDTNGIYADARFTPAYVLRYFMPANVKVRRNAHFGGLLTTADDRTLYVREQGHDGADSAQRGNRGDPATGARIGLSGCNAECEKQWQPFLAPDDAQTTGYWNVYTRADGKKQWAYYGYALYTFAGDEPGQMNGNLIYAPVSDTRVAAAGQTQVQTGPRWRVAPP